MVSLPLFFLNLHFHLPYFIPVFISFSSLPSPSSSSRLKSISLAVIVIINISSLLHPTLIMHNSTPDSPQTPVPDLRSNSPQPDPTDPTISPSLTPSSDHDLHLLPPSLSDLLLATATPSPPPAFTPTSPPVYDTLPSHTTLTEDKENQPPPRILLSFPQLSYISQQPASKPPLKFNIKHDEHTSKRRPRNNVLTNTQPLPPPSISTSSQNVSPVAHTFPRSPLSDITPGRHPTYSTFSQSSTHHATLQHPHSRFSTSYSAEQRSDNSRKAVTHLRFAMR